MIVPLTCPASEFQVTWSPTLKCSVIAMVLFDPQPYRETASDEAIVAAPACERSVRALTLVLRRLPGSDDEPPSCLLRARADRRIGDCHGRATSFQRTRPGDDGSRVRPAPVAERQRSRLHGAQHRL